MSFDRAGLPHGYFFIKENGKLLLMTDYSDESATQVDNTFEITDRKKLTKAAWRDYKGLDGPTRDGLVDDRRALYG